MQTPKDEAHHYRTVGQIPAIGNAETEYTYAHAKTPSYSSHYETIGTSCSKPTKAPSKVPGVSTYEKRTEGGAEGGEGFSVNRSCSLQMPACRKDDAFPWIQVRSQSVVMDDGANDDEQPVLPPRPRPRNPVDRDRSRRKPPAPPPSAQGPSAQYECLEAEDAEQPSSANILGLSVEDVSDCLRQLRLDAYVDEFRRHGVDGVLLSSMDEQMLTGDFAMSSFEARKLAMFVKRGWRPKITDSS